MGRLPQVSGRECINALQKAGFVVVRQTGSHIILRNEKVSVPVPNHKTIKPGTLRSILRRAELTVEQFRELL